jgi:hypothetical protein
MKRVILGSILLLVLVTNCKTHKDVSKNETPQPKMSEQYTDEEKQILSQLEYIPEDHQKQLTPEAKLKLESLAQEKANITCKKRAIQKRIDAGEQVDPNEVSTMESMLVELDKRAAKYLEQPLFVKYFDEKFNEFIKGCLN